jgi:hypothetical protein
MKTHFFLFNIEGYGEFFSGITPLALQLIYIFITEHRNKLTSTLPKYQRFLMFN